MNTAAISQPPPTNNPDDLLDETKLAVKLGVTRSTLQSWRYAAKGPRYIKVGKLVRYRVADIEAYLRAHTRGSNDMVR